jgi:hypothetical protein
MGWNSCSDDLKSSGVCGGIAGGILWKEAVAKLH